MTDSALVAEDRATLSGSMDSVQAAGWAMLTAENEPLVAQQQRQADIVRDTFAAAAEASAARLEAAQRLAARQTAETVAANKTIKEPSAQLVEVAVAQRLAAVCDDDDIDWSGAMDDPFMSQGLLPIW